MCAGSSAVDHRFPGEGAVSKARQQWKSRAGFILAASGSAIGLGNIVFFSANAYKFGAGAFYLPYLIALLAVGVPVMMVEFGLGREKGTSFPLALGRIGGRAGEFAGWFAVVNALMITMYYIAILGWAVGMWWSALAGDLWAETSVAVPAFDVPEGALPNAIASFFDLISSPRNIIFVVFVWLLNIGLVSRGTKTIEGAVKVMVPMIWLIMVGFIIQGLSQPGGVHGVFLLFTPDFSVMGDINVWHGAFAQIFFTLSLGFGIMTAYASYLPKKSDHTTNAVVVSMMNCSFEMIAGFAVFSLLFAFTVTPKASTLSMMFFIMPAAIAELGAAAKLTGAVFFTLLLLAGLSSSISLIEAAVSAVIDKFKTRRVTTVLAVSLVGIAGSVMFALPMVIDGGLDSNGTLGLTILDLIDHYAFGYGLIIVGLVECLIVGWGLPVEKLRATLNSSSSIQLGRWFDIMIKFVVPAILIFVLGYSLLTDVFDVGKEATPGLYGADYVMKGFDALDVIAPVVWLVMTLGIGAALALTPGHKGADGE